MKVCHNRKTDRQFSLAKEKTSRQNQVRKTVKILTVEISPDLDDVFK